MATSETDICNIALSHLGEAPIVSIDEDSLPARACQLLYLSTRDEVLRSHRWNFAEARDTLSQLADAPAFGYAYQYELPADCLRVLEFNGSELGDITSQYWKIEGRRLLSNSETAEIVYTRNITVAAEFDALFVKALALKLAIELSETIRGTTGKTSELTGAYQSVVAPLARRVDANEGRRRKGLLPLNSMFIRARGCGI